MSQSVPLSYEEKSSYPGAPDQVTLKIETAEASNEPQKYFMAVTMTRAETPSQSYYGFWTMAQALKLYEGLQGVFGP